MADFKDGYDPSIKSTSEVNRCADDEGFKQYSELVPAGMYGWFGYGGSLFLWDPQREIGIAYVPTYLAWYDRDKQRGVRCLQELYNCLRL